MELVYFSPVSWSSYFQRPHYMIQYFLNENQDNRVLWFEPYPSRFPTWQDFLRLKKKSTARFQGNNFDSRLKVVRVKALPIEPLKFSEKLNRVLFWNKMLEEMESFWSSNGEKVIGFGKPSRLSLFILSHYKKNSSIKTFYDAMDDFPEFHQGLAKRSMKDIEIKLSQHVDMVTVSSSGLLEKFPRALKILNAYPMESLPIQPKNKKNTQFVFGYVGTIGKWFDWDYVIRLAEWFPKDVIRLIGPQFVPKPIALPKNIEFYPECPQSKAIEYLKEFDVGLIPFKKNHLTHSVDPIKYYEYRGMELPVISTRFGEMSHRCAESYHVIFFEELTVQNCVSMVKNNSIDWQRTSQFRLENDWKNRFNLLQDFLQ